RLQRHQSRMNFMVPLISANHRRGHHFKLRVSSRPGHARFESYDNRVVGALSLAAVGGPAWRVKIGHRLRAEPFGHHADHRVWLAAQKNGLADDCGIALEDPAPGG